jgi:hypothetical protein
MDVPIPSYFTPAQLDDTKATHAALGIIRKSEEALSVGAIVWGSSKLSARWICGYARNHDYLRAEMVRIILEEVPADIPLFVSTKGLSKLLDRAAISNGLTAQGKPFKAFGLLRLLADHRESGRLVIYPPTPETYEEAAAVAVAQQGLPKALLEAITFSTFKQQHPDWYVVGSSDQNQEAA